MANVHSPRLVVIHYHFFKNAGSSVSEILEANFKEKWGEAEFAQTGESNRGAVEEWFRLNRHMVALSTHTASLQLPVLRDTVVFPLIFVRHPLDRLKSMYEFERRQDVDTPEAQLARTVSFSGYVEAFLGQRQNADLLIDRRARNDQTHRLAVYVDSGGSELLRAITALQELPFVGLVERFDASMARVKSLLVSLGLPDFRTFQLCANRGQPVEPLEARLSRMRRDLGNSLFRDLVDNNHDDLTVYRAVAASYGLDDAETYSFQTLRA